MMVKNILEEYRQNKERVRFLEQELKFLEICINDVELLDFESKENLNNKIDVEKQNNIKRIKKEIVFLKHELEQAENFIAAAKNKEDSEILRKRYFLGVSCNQLSIQMHLSERAISKKIQTNIKYIEKIVCMDFMKYEMQ